MANLNTNIVARVTQDTYDEFQEWCNKIDKKPSDMVREFIRAALAGELYIETDDEKKKIIKGLYK